MKIKSNFVMQLVPQHVWHIISWKLSKRIYNGDIPMNILYYGFGITSIGHRQISYQQNIVG
jgi:hypothetical protein